MSERRPIVGGNWKMNTDHRGAVELAAGVAEAVGGIAAVEVVVFPPFPYLLAVRERLEGTNIALGAQDVYFEPNGAFTGEVSVAMLLDCGCRWVLAGHSERRHVLGEDDRLINRKVRAALDGGLNVVLCVGETESQREEGRTDEINASQLRAGLEGVRAELMDRVVIAYEPVWAIGTGKTATPDDAEAAHARLRIALHEIYGGEVAQATRIQYGGSVKPDNAAGLFRQPNIDGGLIGGASLKAGDFAAIVNAAG